MAEYESPKTEQPPPRVFEVAPHNVMGKNRRIAVTVLIVLANLVQMICNLVGVIGGLEISRLLGETGVHASWVAAAFSLTQGTFVLMAGRLGAVYGHKNLLLLGGLWFTVFTIINGFIKNFIAFNTIRALAGIGGGIILPNAVAMIAITNPPGKARNLSLGFFGASAPIGGYLGGIIVGLFLKYSQIEWCFLFLALLSLTIFIPLFFLLPREVPVDKHGTIDWIGAAFGTTALILFNFVWNQAPAVGWQTGYEIALLIVSLICFVTFLAWERWGTLEAILPLEIFKTPSFGPLMLVVLLNYMAFGTLLWYMIIWQQDLRARSVMQVAVGWTPFLVCGIGAAGLAAFLIPRLAAQWILAIGTATVAIASVILATMPAQQSYWAQVFPATVIMSFCPDLVFTAAQIIASNSVRRHQQGIAGSLIGTLNLYGNSLGLGFAATVQTQVAKNTKNAALPYRAALYFSVGIGIIALVLDVLFVRVVKDEREGWEDAHDSDPADSIGLEETTLRGTSIGTWGSGTELRTVGQRTSWAPLPMALVRQDEPDWLMNELLRTPPWGASRGLRTSGQRTSWVPGRWGSQRQAVTSSERNSWALPISLVRQDDGPDWLMTEFLRTSTERIFSITYE